MRLAVLALAALLAMTGAPRGAQRWVIPFDRSLLMGLADSDRDLIIRTVIGEAANQPTAGQKAVAAVVMNRLNSGKFGGSVRDVLFAPKQFEPWTTRRAALMAIGTDDPRYQRAAASTDAALAGDDPSQGATHFANVDTVKGRGNSTALRWLAGMSNVSKIGAHTFGNASGKGSGGNVRYVDTSDDDTGSGGGGGRTRSTGDFSPAPMTAYQKQVRSLMGEISSQLRASLGAGDGKGAQDATEAEPAEADRGAEPAAPSAPALSPIEAPAVAPGVSMPATSLAGVMAAIRAQQQGGGDGGVA